MLLCGGADRPYGEPRYLPIFEAAAECGLPVAIHSGGEGLVDLKQFPAPAERGDHAQGGTHGRGPGVGLADKLAESRDRPPVGQRVFEPWPGVVGDGDLGQHRHDRLAGTGVRGCP